jgi:hypothetical protein
MKTITMSLETTQIYIPPDVHLFLKAQTLRFPIQNIQFQQFTLEDNIMTAASLNPLSTYKHPLEIEFIGSINRMLLGFRTEASNLAGQRTVLLPPQSASTNTNTTTNINSFINTLRLNIANIDRVKQWDKAIFKEVTSYWKNNRMALQLNDTSKPQEVYTITLGGYDSDAPMGTLNFSRAVDTTLFLTLAAIDYDERTISRKSFALLYAETWNVYEISSGKGRLMFDDS